MPKSALIQANSLHIPLPDKYIHCIVTSPPYWGLRKYAGMFDLEWPSVVYLPMTEMPYPIKIPAWKGELGLEPTVGAFIGHMVLIFDELWRVLRNDGAAWINMGDTYAGSGQGWCKDKSVSYSRRWLKEWGRDAPPGYTHNTTKVGQLKKKDMIGIPWRLALALQARGWWLRSDVIWCLSGGVRIYAQTQNREGPMMIRDLSRLDPSTIKLWNGEKWVQVLNFEPVASRPEKPIEIELRSGEQIGCTSGHLWPTQRGLVKAKDLRVGDILQKTRLPEPETAGLLHLPDEEIGWFVGLYIAEGSRGGHHGERIQIAGNITEKPRFERLKRIAAAYGGTCRWHQVGEKAVTITLTGKVLNAILDTYINGNTAKRKHLAPVAWERSNAFLEAVLMGYLEGDGCWREKQKRWQLGFTRNMEWAADLRTICARLGYWLIVKKSHALCSTTGERFPSMRGEIRFERSGHHAEKSREEIVAIKGSSARRFYQIEVEEPHLFALASGVLTQNSKRNPMPESVRDRPAKAHEHVFLLTKKHKYFYDHVAVRQPAKYGKRQWVDVRGMYESGTKGKRVKGQIKGKEINPTHNLLSVWNLSTEPYAGAHFATYPQKLVEPCILAGTSAKGCCPVCGAPWKRIVKTSAKYTKLKSEMLGKTHATPELEPEEGKNAGWGCRKPRISAEYETAGWEPTCECKPELDEYNPERMGQLDPSSRARRMNARVKQARDAGAVHDLAMTPRFETLRWQPTCECVGSPGSGLITCPKCGGTGEETKYLPDKRSQAIGAEFSRNASASGGVINYEPEETGEKCPVCGGVGLVEGTVWPEGMDTWPTVPCRVLDPFAGSGTTLLVARKLGRDGIGLDLSYAYLKEQAKKRLEKPTQYQML
jgi:DNA modification methylase